MRYGRSNFFLGKPLIKRIIHLKACGFITPAVAQIYDKASNCTVHFINRKLYIHNGKSFPSYTFNKWSCGFKIGEFI